MPNKYIIEGAAFNGDGTSSAAATVAGGVGAWNTIAYFEGATPAYGSIAAGDTVYIRSKTAAGANITRTWSTSVSYGSANATISEPIYWILDAGNVWPGISGTLTYTTTAANGITLRHFNSIEADTKASWRFINTNTGQPNANLVAFQDNCIGKNLYFDTSAAASNGASVLLGTGNSAGARSMLISPTFKVGSRQPGRGIISTPDYSKVTLIDPDIELLVTIIDNQVFSLGSYGASMEIYGGQIYGAGASSRVPLVDIQRSHAGLRIYGMDIPKVMALVTPTIYSSQHPGQVELFAVDGGMGSAFADCRTGQYDNRSDGYYPTLNAYLPTSTPEAWSWKIFPNHVAENRPLRVPSIQLFTQEAAAKTLTCNFLFADSFVQVDTNNTWIDVQYTDAATGQMKSITSRTRERNVVADSAASWNATTYGPVNLLKRHIQVTTPTAIKKDTVVIVTFRTCAKALTENDIMFLCPDVVLT